MFCCKVVLIRHHNCLLIREHAFTIMLFTQWSLRRGELSAHSRHWPLFHPLCETRTATYVVLPVKATSPQGTLSFVLLGNVASEARLLTVLPTPRSFTAHWKMQSHCTQPLGPSSNGLACMGSSVISWSDCHKVVVGLQLIRIKWIVMGNLVYKM